MRPTCVLLMGECCNGGLTYTQHDTSSTKLDIASKQRDIASKQRDIASKQRDIALITELIHVASLVHDDVLDSADTRRALATVNSLFNEKVAILSGDFIIARATSKLAELGCSETITILSSVIRDLIKGEILQLKRGQDEDMFATYLDKTYLKTASLIAHGCQAVALNSTHPHLQHTAYNYGKHLGVAFQLIDDLLDFVATSQQLGKAAGGSDLKLGLATAPVLYASLKHPHLLECIERGFSGRGDVATALDCVADSEGVEQTRQLAARYCDMARRSLEELPAGHFNAGLSALCDIVLRRTS